VKIKTGGKFMQFLSAHYLDILAVAVFLIAMLLLIKNGYKPKVKEILFYLVTQAEKQFGEKQGQLKYACVVTWLYERLPAVCRFFFTQKELNALIESAVKRMKEYLLSEQKAKEIVG
jgi:hypothetical protein